MSDVAEKELYVVVRRRYTNEEYSFNRWEIVGYTEDINRAYIIVLESIKKAGYLDVVAFVSSEFVSSVEEYADTLWISEGEGRFKSVLNKPKTLGYLEGPEIDPATYVATDAAF